MALISRYEATQGPGDLSNAQALCAARKPLTREQVTTQLALEKFDEMNQARVGFGHTIRRLLATTTTFAAVLSAPFIALLSIIWFGAAELQRLSILDSWTFAMSGSALAAAIAADLAVGKLFGVRPITACMIAIYDMHRNVAKTISDRVDESYKNEEKALKALRQERRTEMLQNLGNTYQGVATQIQALKPEERQQLEKQLPAFAKALQSMQLTQSEISSILDPLRGAFQLAQRPNVNAPASALG
ncbi:MAG: hypothetical protein KGR16_05165 [Verrucomicrobia bacterium]|nr:hypothetical protein [Verrucomicrobiota bacterium]MDE3047134.1 hypothetical protein [Verrucomicrobiota bacterium]